MRRHLRTANGAAASCGARSRLSPWCEPERVPYYSLPRRTPARHRAVPAPDLDAPGTIRFADLEGTRRDFQVAGLVTDHTEERNQQVFEAETTEQVIDVRARPVRSGVKSAWKSVLAILVVTTRLPTTVTS
jgi:hypothetical protein